MENQDIQEIKKKKRSLKRYRNNLACIGRLEEKLTLLDKRIKSVRSPNYSGMPRGGTPVTIEELLSDKVDLEKRIDRLKVKNRKVKNQILEEIDSLEDSRYCEILEAYFIDCMSMEDIAEEMGYSTRWAYDLYSEAVEELTFNITT
jgi:predicted DNA-binding protein YlxM (UPF0122 family)